MGRGQNKTKPKKNTSHSVFREFNILCAGASEICILALFTLQLSLKMSSGWYLFFTEEGKQEVSIGKCCENYRVPVFSCFHVYWIGILQCSYFIVILYALKIVKEKKKLYVQVNGSLFLTVCHWLGQYL